MCFTWYVTQVNQGERKPIGNPHPLTCRGTGLLPAYREIWWSCWNFQRWASEESLHQVCCLLKDLHACTVAYFLGNFYLLPWAKLHSCKDFQDDFISSYNPLSPCFSLNFESLLLPVSIILPYLGRCDFWTSVFTQGNIEHFVLIALKIIVLKNTWFYMICGGNTSL